jgi:hypothetical protein
MSQHAVTPRWMGVGRSMDPDSRRAARAAAGEAITGDELKLIIVFAAITHDPAGLLAGLREAAPGVPVIGCSTHGEIAPGGPSDGSVTVAALGGTGFAVSTAVAERVSGRQREAGAQLAQCAKEVADRPHRALLLLTDGLIRDQEAILRGCYGVLGAGVPLVGGAAADGWRMTGAYLLSDDRPLTDAVVAAAIGSDAPLSVAVHHGWHKVGQPMVVTSSGNGRVYTLDDRPALDVYLDRLGAPREAYVDPELTWAMTGDEESILAAVDAACEEALAGLSGRTPVGLLTLSCAALRAVLGDDGIQRESARLAKWAEGAPYAGFYTYGEIARVRGIDGFYNQTLVVLALS